MLSPVKSMSYKCYKVLTSWQNLQATTAYSYACAMPYHACFNAIRCYSSGITLNYYVRLCLNKVTMLWRMQGTLQHIARSIAGR